LRYLIIFSNRFLLTNKGKLLRNSTEGMLGFLIVFLVWSFNVNLWLKIINLSPYLFIIILCWKINNVTRALVLQFLITFIVGDDVIEDVVKAIGIILVVRTSSDQILFAKGATFACAQALKRSGFNFNKTMPTVPKKARPFWNTMQTCLTFKMV